MHRLIFTAAVLALIPVAALAEDHRGPYQYDNVIYTMPAGWTKGKTTPQYALIYDDEGRFKTLQIYRSRPLPKDLDAWLRGFAAKDVEDKEQLDEVVDVKAIRVGRTDCRMMATRMKGGDVRFYIAMPVGDRLELVRYEGPGGDADDLKETAAVFGKIADPFATALRFVSKGTPPVLTPAEPGPLEGIYFGSRLQMVGMNMQAQSIFYVFDKDGRFVDEIPDGVALAKPDLAALQKNFPQDAGHYYVKGGKITLRHADGGTDTDDFEIDDGKSDGKPGLKIDGQWLTKVPVPADGTKLDGTYSSSFYSSSGFAGSDNFTSVSGGSSYSFKPGGVFSTDGFVGYSGSAGGGDSVTTFGGYSDKPDKIGTYAIKDGLITLKFKDGTTKTKNILLVEDALLYLDGGQYLDRSKTE